MLYLAIKHADNKHACLSEDVTNMFVRCLKGHGAVGANEGEKITVESSICLCASICPES